MCQQYRIGNRHLYLALLEYHKLNLQFLWFRLVYWAMSYFIVFSKTKKGCNVGELSPGEIGIFGKFYVKCPLNTAYRNTEVLSQCNREAFPHVCYGQLT